MDPDEAAAAILLACLVLLLAVFFIGYAIGRTPPPVSQISPTKSL